MERRAYESTTVNTKTTKCRNDKVSTGGKKCCTRKNMNNLDNCFNCAYFLYAL